MFPASPDKERASAAPASSGAPSEDLFPSSRHFKVLITVLMAYFGLRLLFLATTISPLIPPDETTHVGLCTIFSRFAFLPVNSPDSYQYGLVTNVPWLYYWIMGKLLSLNFLGMSDLVYLRLLNIPVAFGFVYYVWRTLSLLTEDRLSRILLLVFMTNTMMLTFLSASVSYDNLANLLSAMSVYYLLAFFKERSPALLAASLICQLAGCLTKISFLPLVLVLGLILMIHEFKNLPKLPSGLAMGFRHPGRAGTILTLALLLGLALNVQLYGGNYLNYRAIVPQMTAVLPLESAMQYRLVARNYIVDLFREGRVSKAQALEMTGKISHPGDRADAVAVIESYERFKKSGGPMGLASYAALWTKRMSSGIYGVFGHILMPTTWPLIAPIALVAALTVVALLVRWRPRDALWLPTQLLVITGFYLFFLFYKINYQAYLDSGTPYLALQGRYVFPVIGPIYVLSSFYLLRLFRGRGARLGIWGLAVVIFLVCDFPMFLSRITPEWAYWPPN